MSNYIMADREGFEPSIDFHLYTRSRRAPSTTRPPAPTIIILRDTLFGGLVGLFGRFADASLPGHLPQPLI